MSILLLGDSRNVLAELAADSIDACITDAPYELGFMGRAWDKTGIANDPAFWALVLRVLKPGAHLLAFSHSRTYHRMACAIEDAGFEIRDSIDWWYGTGFPKSLDVSKAIDKARIEDQEPVRVVCRFLRAVMDSKELKSSQIAEHFGCHSRLVDHWAARDTDSQPNLPTWEQWLELKRLLAFGDEMDAEVWRLNGRKGTPGEAWQNAEVIGRHEGSTPGLAGERFSRRDDLIRAPSENAERWSGWGTALKPAKEPICLARKPLDGTVAENVIAHGTGGLNIDGCRIAGPPKEGGPRRYTALGVMDDDGWQAKTQEIDRGGKRWPANVIMDEAVAAELDRQSGNRQSGAWDGTRNAEKTRSVYGAFAGRNAEHPREFSEGGASRFFYVAKPTRYERDLGCEHLPKRSAGEATDREDDTDGLSSPRAGAGRTGGARNFHPTVKPVMLMRYLCRLVTPPGGTIIDPFMGSGSTGIAAALEGFDFIGIEREAEYMAIAKARIDLAQKAPRAFEPEAERAEKTDDRQQSLFGGTP